MSAIFYEIITRFHLDHRHPPFPDTLTDLGLAGTYYGLVLEYSPFIISVSASKLKY